VSKRTALQRLKSVFIKEDPHDPKIKNRQMSALDGWRRSGFPNYDQVSLEGEAALAISYVWAALNGISSDIASLNWSPYERTDRGREVAYEHSTYDLLKHKAYFAYNSTVWRRAWVANYLFTGDGFTEVLRDKRTGEPRGLRLWHKKDIEILIDYKAEELVYRIVPEDREIPSLNMLHLSDLSFDGLFGLSRMEAMRNTLEIATRMDETQNDLQKNGTFLGGYIKIDKVLSEDQIQKYRESFKDVYGGSTGEVAILDEGSTFTPFDYTMTMADAEFIASRRFTGEEILRFMRYPQHMANSLERSTNNNIEQQALEYVNYCLRPIIVLMENEMNGKLIIKSKRRKNYIKGDLNSLLRGDIASRTQLYETLWKIGALTGNDARELEDMNRIEGADTLYADLNTIPQEKMGPYWDAKIGDLRNEFEEE